MGLVNPYETSGVPAAAPRSGRRAGAVVAASAAGLVTGGGAAQAVDLGFDLDSVSTVAAASFPSVGTTLPELTVASALPDAVSIAPSTLSLSTPAVQDITLPSVVAPPNPPSPPTTPPTPGPVTTSPVVAPPPDATSTPTPTPVVTAVPVTTPTAAPVTTPTTAPEAAPVPGTVPTVQLSLSTGGSTGDPGTTGASDFDSPLNSSNITTTAITAATDLDASAPNHPDQAAVFKAAADNPELVDQLFATRIADPTTVERDLVVQDVQKNLRDLSLASEPLDQETAEKYFPGDTAAQQLALASGSGFTAPETACWVLFCEDGTARVPELVLGGSSEMQAQLPPAQVDGQKVVDQCLAHCHPVDPEADVNLSYPDMISAGTARALTGTPTTIAAGDLLTDTVIHGKNVGGDIEITTFPSTPGVPISDQIVVPSAPDTDAVSPFPLGVLDVEPRGTNALRQDALRSWKEVDPSEQDALDTAAAELEEWEAQLSASTGIEQGDIKYLAEFAGSDPAVEAELAALEAEMFGEGGAVETSADASPGGAGGITITPEIAPGEDPLGSNPVGGTEVPPPVEPGRQVLPPTPDTGGDPTDTPTAPTGDGQPGTPPLSTTDDELRQVLDGPGGVPGLFPGAPVGEDGLDATDTGTDSDADTEPTGTVPTVTTTIDFGEGEQELGTTEYLPGGTVRTTSPDGTVTLEGGTPPADSATQQRVDAFTEIAGTVEAINGPSGAALGRGVQTAVDAAATAGEVAGGIAQDVLSLPLLPLVGAGEGGVPVFSGP